MKASIGTRLRQSLDRVADQLPTARPEDLPELRSRAEALLIALLLLDAPPPPRGQTATAWCPHCHSWAQVPMNQEPPAKAGDCDCGRTTVERGGNVIRRLFQSGDPVTLDELLGSGRTTP
jgi:hypothetical protein